MEVLLCNPTVTLKRDFCRSESNEVAGACLGFRTVWQKALDAGEVVPVVEVPPKPAPDFPKIPLPSIWRRPTRRVN